MGGLEPGRRYAFRCSAINAQGSSGWGPVAQLDTQPGLPFPVDCLSLAAATSTSLRLQWSQPYGQGALVTGYVLEVADAAALEQQAGADVDALFSATHQGPECSATGAPAMLLRAACALQLWEPLVQAADGDAACSLLNEPPSRLEPATVLQLAGCRKVLHWLLFLPPAPCHSVQ